MNNRIAIIKHKDRQTDRDRQTNRQTDKQTDKQTQTDYDFISSVCRQNHV